MRGDRRRAGLQRRRLTATLVLMLAGVAAVLVPSSPAYAHDQLVAQTPAAGEHLDVAPTEIAVTFSSAPLGIGASVVVLDAEERDWSAGALRMDGARIVQDVDADMPAGEYEVRWRIVSADGHPLSESFRFSVGAGAPATAAPERTAPPTVVAADHAEESTDPPAVLVGVAGIVLGGIVLGGIALILVRRARRARDESSTRTSGADGDAG